MQTQPHSEVAEVAARIVAGVAEGLARSESAAEARHKAVPAVLIVRVELIAAPVALVALVALAVVLC